MLRSLWRTSIGEKAQVRFNPISPGVNPQIFKGQVIVLIGPGTMSSASLLAATIKEFDIGTLVGEETGGYPTHFGNTLSFHLPNTGLKVEIASTVNYGNGTGPVVPDIRVSQSIQDLIVGQDTLLAFAAK
jgi:C-terminal processing protease CtpA/Prc